MDGDKYLINEWHYAWDFFFFTRCVFSDIIRLNNLNFQVICRFRHLNSNIIRFSFRYFSLKILLKSVMSFLEFRCRYFFDLKKKIRQSLTWCSWADFAQKLDNIQEFLSSKNNHRIIFWSWSIIINYRILFLSM